MSYNISLKFVVDLEKSNILQKEFSCDFTREPKGEITLLGKRTDFST